MAGIPGGYVSGGGTTYGFVKSRVRADQAQRQWYCNTCRLSAGCVRGWPAHWQWHPPASQERAKSSHSKHWYLLQVGPRASRVGVQNFATCRVASMLSTSATINLGAHKVDWPLPIRGLLLVPLVSQTSSQPIVTETCIPGHATYPQ